MKYYLIAGEASGDLHASNLMKALKSKDVAADFRYFGGDLMQEEGGELVKHYREMAFMGVIPVLLNIRTIMRNMRICREDIRVYKPDVVILIDYPGFNLKIAQFVKTKLNIPVYYYISPKIWAWKKYRIKSFRKYVDRMFCILPFEVDFFKSLNYKVDYVGNPSVDSVSAFREEMKNRPDTFVENNGLKDKPILAILAGSRKAEIKQNLPAMLSVAADFPEYNAVIAGAPGLTPDDYKRCGECRVKIVYGQTYEILRHASVAMVTSGTATLETALFRVPQVVCYYMNGGKLVNFVFKNFFHVPYISLVNLIAGSEVVRELFGAEFSYKKIHAELTRIVRDDKYRNEMLAGYDRVISILGEPGASERTAGFIVDSLNVNILNK
jgi:lipid-A-disaccharide synthase